jgi:SP family galactose:H+ symporter-like MFS transporter
MAQGLNTRPTEASPLIDVPPEGLRRIGRWGLVIALGSFLFGFDTGIISGALLFIKRAFGLGAFEQGSVVSVLLLGAITGAILSGRVSDRFGRRPTLAALGVTFTVGVAIAALATGYWMVLLGRVVMGLGVGGVSAVVPTYLAEMSPAQIRGRMLTLNQLLITVGLLAAYVVNLVFAGSQNWRAMFWVGAVPALALAAGVLRIPESPAWLLSKGRVGEAKAEIAAVAGEQGADQAVQLFRREDGMRPPAQARDQQRKGWRVLESPHLRPALVVGITLATLQQFAGINTIIYYAPTIMQKTGLSASNSILYSVAIGVINLTMTVVSIRLIDRVGRRPLLMVSLAGMLASLLLLGLSFVVGLSSVITLICILLYIVAFAIGMGPVFWVLLGEIFPTRARAEGVAAGSSVNWLTNFAVSLVFLPLVQWIGQGETFWVFAVVCTFALWFVNRYVPETRERNYEEIDSELLARSTGEAPVAAVQAS